MRTVEVTTRLADYLDWPGAHSVLKITRDVTRAGARTREIAYAISDLTPQEMSANDFLTAVRRHWGIENNLHWQRDVNFEEDRCRARTGSAAQVLAAVRNTALALIRLSGSTRIAAALRRLSLRPLEAVRLVRRC